MGLDELESLNVVHHVRLQEGTKQREDFASIPQTTAGELAHDERMAEDLFIEQQLRERGIRRREVFSSMPVKRLACSTRASSKFNVVRICMSMHITYRRVKATVTQPAECTRVTIR